MHVFLSRHFFTFKGRYFSSINPSKTIFCVSFFLRLRIEICVRDFNSSIATSSFGSRDLLVQNLLLTVMSESDKRRELLEAICARRKTLCSPRRIPEELSKESNKLANPSDVAAPTPVTPSASPNAFAVNFQNAKRVSPTALLLKDALAAMNKLNPSPSSRQAHGVGKCHEEQDNPNNTDASQYSTASPSSATSSFSNAASSSLPTTQFLWHRSPISSNELKNQRLDTSNDTSLFAAFQQAKDDNDFSLHDSASTVASVALPFLHKNNATQEHEPLTLKNRNSFFWSAIETPVKDDPETTLCTSSETPRSATVDTRPLYALSTNNAYSPPKIRGAHYSNYDAFLRLDSLCKPAESVKVTPSTPHEQHYPFASSDDTWPHEKTDGQSCSRKPVWNGMSGYKVVTEPHEVQHLWPMLFSRLLTSDT